MLNLKKEATPVIEIGELKVAKCRACSSYISHIYFMEDSVSKKKSKWYSCSCGVVWQAEVPSGSKPKHALEGSKLRDIMQYPIRIYAPIMEELMYGRRILLMGHQVEDQMDYFKERGWIPETCDFESAELQPDTKFNAIWFQHTLETLKDPISALSRCKQILTEDGILFIASPDTDFIHTRGSSGFRHWKPEYNYLMWNLRSISKQLENLGFNVIMSRQNADMRFSETDDFHLIAQVKYF